MAVGGKLSASLLDVSMSAATGALLRPLIMFVAGAMYMS